MLAGPCGPETRRGRAVLPARRLLAPHVLRFCLSLRVVFPLCVPLSPPLEGHPRWLHLNCISSAVTCGYWGEDFNMSCWGLNDKEISEPLLGHTARAQPRPDFSFRLLIVVLLEEHSRPHTQGVL